jgi:asparagine synthase (glutamine-hydrolysing)
MPWYEAINDAARERKLTVLLSAGLGNLTMSYAGLALLAEWARAWRLIALSRQLRLLVRNGDMRWRGALWATLSPFVSRSLWLWVNRRFADMDLDPLRWTAIQPERLARLLLLAQERQLDVPSRPARDGFTQRTDWLCHNDSGNMRKGMLAGWGIDHRDPMGDRRLIEFCLSVPTDQFLRDGVQRALARRTLADRIPQQVLAARARGLQAVDWHEMLTRSRDRIGDEVDRLAACAPAAQLLDLPRMRTLVDKWPKDGWERNDTILSYRIALLRGISVGHFLRCAGGANG